MRLLPLELDRSSNFDDGEWIEKPGFPPSEGTWLHPTQGALPEFEFEDGHDKTKNEPPFSLTIGTHEDAHIRVDNPLIPRRHCKVFKEGRNWYLEAVSAKQNVWLGEICLERGVPAKLKSGDIFSMLLPPTSMAYRIEFDEADNWYLDLGSEKDYPNRWPAKMPGHPSESPPAPEELKRLAWQTDQMRRRSEEDQVRVADWAAFSQYVKKHYHKYGIEAKPWRGSVGPPVPRPPPMPPRPYPDWIADVILEERMLPYVSCDYPFRENLEISGYELPASLTPRAMLPSGHVSTWGECNQDLFKSGGSAAMVGDTTLYAAAMACATSLSQDRVGPSESSPAVMAPRAESSLDMVGPSESSAEDLQNKEQDATLISTLPVLQANFREWLTGMEDAPFVMQYHDPLAAQFDSLRQLVDLYVSGGDLDERFFSVVGVKKLGHKRVFQKWFKDHCSPP